MTESRKESIDEKEIAWYAAGLGAWYATRLEHDKSLLTLSAGGIGLLITLESTVGIPSLTAMIFASLAILAFIACLVAVLLIFKGNSDHLEEVVQAGKGHSPRLAFLDRFAIYAFLVGVILSCVVGFAGAAHSVATKGFGMADDKKTKTTTYAADSVNGVHRMKPVDKISKSFNGVGNMAPASQGAAQSQAAPPQPEKVPASTPAVAKPSGPKSK
jgi:hypothetical protein